MLEPQLLQTVPDLQLHDFALVDHVLVFELAARAVAAACPLCGFLARRVHSHYCRHPADLPWSAYPVRYSLRVRRFFCDNPGCGRRIFAARFGPALRAYARRTSVRATRLQALGLTVGGAVGAALATLVGTPLSPSTMLRLLRTAELPTPPTPRVLSVDDFAFRKGHTYGTILVDLEQHCPVDLLPDREPATVAAWLREHPGIEIISRDRASGYAQAAQAGAPGAAQIADRYHLFANLGEALQRLVDRQPAALQAVTEQLAHLATTAAVAPDSAPGATRAVVAEPALPQTPPLAERAVSAAEAGPGSQDRPDPASPRVVQRFAAIKELQDQGYGQRAIARRLRLHRRTVARYMRAEQPPPRAQGRAAPSQAQGYLPYLRRRWAEGCHNALTLWAELQAAGFTGSYSSVYRLVVRRLGPVSRSRRRGGSSATGDAPEARTVEPLTAREARWLLARPQSPLCTAEEQARQLLCAASPNLAVAYDLAQRFGTLLRERQPAGLAAWLADAKKSGVAELRNFALGIERDQEAVQGAMSQPWSQGQTEGQVNRLKLIKRTGYGRMKFALLRLRVLYRPNRWAVGTNHQK